jgi:tRNA A-37 threonylcarbamoyl transferase component Bud32
MAEMKKDFGAFELQQKIGAGGMASVYLAVQKSLDRKVVLKVLYPHLAEDEKLVARFEREARAAATLRHPNIVQVIDCGRHEDVAYIAMEFIEGLDLKKWIEQHGAPPIEIALLMLRELCSGLEHAHQNRIVHRDIKPANLMFTPGGVIKIMDFGLARKGEDSTAVTVAGSVLGTPAYMSPEQATGEHVDERTDIFSVGVVAYELLGGQRPFQGDSYSTVLRAILTVEPPPLEEFNPLVPAQAVQVVQRMLQKDTARRYQSIGQVRDDLETVIEEMGLLRASGLLREYARDPGTVGEMLRKKRLARHLDQGLYFENMGLGKIDDALLEFRRVLHLDADNKVAREHLKKLEKERQKILAERATEGTVVMPPEADRTMVMPAEAGAPAPGAPAGAGPRAAAGRPGRPQAPPPRPAPAAAGGARRGPNPLLIGGAVVLIAALAVVAFLLLRPPADDSTAASGTGIDAGALATPPEVAATPDAGGTPAPGGAAVVTTANLRIDTDPPGARLFVNGVVESLKSGLRKEGLAPGDYTIRAEKAGYIAGEQAVTLKAGDEGQVRITLKPEPGAMGTLVVKVTPFASYFVNDQPQGQPNTVTAQLELKPGVYTVKAVHPSFEPRVWKGVRVEPRGTTRLSHDFLKLSVGTLKVMSSGGWAEVYLDGKATGKYTPAEFTDLKPGRYVVSLVRPGFVSETGAKTVNVQEGKSAAVEFVIKPQ